MEPTSGAAPVTDLRGSPRDDRLSREVAMSTRDDTGSRVRISRTRISRIQAISCAHEVVP
jgi:hypothetical protein